MCISRSHYVYDLTFLEKCYICAYQFTIMASSPKLEFLKEIAWYTEVAVISFRQASANACYNCIWWSDLEWSIWGKMFTLRKRGGGNEQLLVTLCGVQL